MKVDIVEADFESAAHREAVIAVLDSYARDPVGGGEPLAQEVRERLVPLLRDHPASWVLLAELPEGLPEARLRARAEARPEAVPEAGAPEGTGSESAQPAPRVVGLAVCVLSLSTFKGRPVLNVGDLAVLPECRGQGIGRMLLREVERRARALGCCRMSLEAQDSNRPAMGLYRSFGFDDLMFGDSGPTRFLVKPLVAEQRG